MDKIAYVVFVDNYVGGIMAMPYHNLPTNLGSWYNKAAAIITRGGYAEAYRLARQFNATTGV